MPDKGDRQGILGFTRTPSEDDPRRDPAPAGVDRAPRARDRAPAGDRRHHPLARGRPHRHRRPGGALVPLLGRHAPRPGLHGQHLYELAKMDGAIILRDNLSKIAYANVQLMPDPTISSNETGTRHRTAERVAKQTGALVVSISQQRETVTIFQGQQRYQLDPVADRAREDEPGPGDARHLPHAPRAGADEADGARVPERRRARRRAHRAPARGDDHADGRGDRAQLRRARLGGARDPDAPDRAARRGARRRRRRSSTTSTSPARARRPCSRARASPR